MKFTDYDLHPEIYKSIEKMGFIDATPIQEAVIHHVLNGRDVAGLAQTGTGKTAAFVIPLLNRLLLSLDQAGQKGGAPQAAEPEPTAEETEVQTAEQEAAQQAALDALGENAHPEEIKKERFFRDWKPNHFILVLVPTRELADQVCAEIEKLRGDTSVRGVAVYGGTAYEKQIADIKNGAEFVVGTPGRLIDLYKSHYVDFKRVRAIVFDEADRMFDMGFRDDMRYILQRVPKTRQFLVFSATLNFDVLNTAYTFGANPIEFNVSKDQAKAEHVKDEIFHVGHFDKPQHLLSLLKKEEPKQVIVFSNFKHNVERIARFLTANNHPAMGISSLLTQNQRNRVMAQFKAEGNNQNILVATDVAARGLDIRGVDLVVNYELPDDAENYVHRIGRTGRAGAEGHAFSFVSDRDVEALMRIEDYLKHKVAVGWIDDSELIKEFQPMPADEGRRRDGGDRGPRPPRGGDRPRRSEGESRGPRPDRGPRGPRPEGRPDRGPRADGEGGRDVRRDRPPREDRPSRQDSRPERSEKAPPEKLQWTPKGEKPPPRESPSSGNGPNQHRDRRMGRHSGRSSVLEKSNGPRSERSDRHHNRGRGRSGGHQQRHGRPHHQSGGKGGKPSIGQKITGFFKKLFGSGPTKTRS